MSEENSPGEPIRTLTRPQRRVLGTLIEKAFTTPEYYPLTLKALASGANQKSNRSPVTHYSEDQLQETLDELQRLGLTATVHTESGRTERFRHYIRKVFDWSEPQLAIMTELWLRGRQQLGELRSRASRMVSIDSLDVLRSELQILLDQKFIQASGPLDRRGIEVDHNFYLETEGMTLTEVVQGTSTSTQSERPIENCAAQPESQRESTPQASPSDYSARLLAIEQMLDSQRLENQHLREQVETLSQELANHREQMEQLRRDLGA